MHKQPLAVGLAICALSIAAAIAIAIASGCQAMRDLDRTIWGAPPGTDPQDPQSGDTNPPAAPPIVEIAASLLAVGGFGGMARWISKAKAAANGRCDRLQADVDRLQRLLDEHSGHSHPDIG